jgi:hypothetical protein
VLPFPAVPPFPAVLPFLAVPPFLAVLPFLAVPPFLAVAWAPLRAFRARLDFEAVIRASPPVVSRLAVRGVPGLKMRPASDARLYPAVTASSLRVSC